MQHQLCQAGIMASIDRLNCFNVSKRLYAFCGL